MKETMKHITRPGFTLIELLVVIALIMLMISILLPALHGAREVAYTTVCQSKEHQLSIALNAYGGDYNWSLPPFVWALGDGSSYPWTGQNVERINLGLLWPEYLTAGREFHCPTSAHYTWETRGVWRFEGNINDDGVAFSYAYRKLFRDLSVSDKAILADFFMWAASGSSSMRAGYENHEKGYNVLFADGHVSFVYDYQQDNIWTYIGSSNVSAWYGNDDSPWQYLDQQF